MRGYVDGVRAHIAELRDVPDPARRAWSAALEAAELEARGGGPLPSTPESVCGPEEARAWLLVAVVEIRRAWLSFDLEAAELAVTRADALEDAAGETSAALVVWRHLVRADRGSRSTLPHRDVRAQAVAEADAGTVIALGVAQAVTAELAGDLGEALSHARRASRMARTEAWPQQEYLANTALARYRRLTGHPHLAARILRSLSEIGSPQWRPWLSWELLLAGAVGEAAKLAESDAGGGRAVACTRAALEVLEAARAGDRGRFQGAASRLRASAKPSRRLSLDAEALLGALDAQSAIEDAHGGLACWSRGQRVNPPRGLQGLAAAYEKTDGMRGALVFVAVDAGAGRRVLSPGHRLLGDRFERLPQSQRHQGRMDTMAAVLALAGPAGLARDELFLRVYEFAFDEEIHTGALRKLLKRVADWTGRRATLHAEGDHYRLEVRSPMLVADPRCAPTVPVRVLGMLARSGSTSAREAAKRLGIPLRTAQAALQALLQDGACQRVRSGNAVRYEIEDTTFSEPTRH